MTSPTNAQLLAGRTLGSADSSFVIAEWRDPGTPQGWDPNSPRWIAPLHLHHNDDEAWYVLEGKLCVKVGGDTVEASAGAAVLAPRGTPHTYWNPDPAPVRYLLIMTPRIHQLIQAIHAAQDRSADAMRALFKSYDSELL
ncbi:MAG TPA: cupin domain-containing protein [Terracidiphilus sp.]|jgi:mannose-6-phosphate isomerase-like protein (cupin superfamily)